VSSLLTLLKAGLPLAVLELAALPGLIILPNVGLTRPGLSAPPLCLGAAKDHASSGEVTT